MAYAIAQNLLQGFSDGKDKLAAMTTCMLYICVLQTASMWWLVNQQYFAIYVIYVYNLFLTIQYVMEW